MSHHLLHYKNTLQAKELEVYIKTCIFLYGSIHTQDNMTANAATWYFTAHFWSGPEVVSSFEAFLREFSTKLFLTTFPRGGSR